jgi:nucleoid-associated protein YgaU
MADTQTKKDNPKDGLALIVGGLFILALVFATYNYFNKSAKTNKVEEIQQESVFESGKSAPGDLNGEGAKTQAVSKPTTAKPTGTGGQIAGASIKEWVATDYKKGDIKGASYTVKSGDTLWEIAEGAYGNGAEWTKILEANKSSIDFLPNGSQALIRPGQVLVLP